MQSIVKDVWITRDFRLESGDVLPELTLVPPSIAPAVMDALARAGVPASYFEIDTELGHVASGPEWARWAPALRRFLEDLDR